MATIYLSFTVYLTDQALVNEMQALYTAANPYVHAPTKAATEFGIAYQTRDQPFVAPCVRTEWHPKESSGKFHYDEAVFRIKKGGFFGWLVGSNDRFVWVGKFQYSPLPGAVPDEDDGDGPIEIAAISNRYWADGIDLHTAASAGSTSVGEGGGGSPRTALRDASRTPGGYGARIRSSDDNVSHDPSDLVPGTNVGNIWLRWYMRPRRFDPNVATGVQIFSHTSSGGQGGESIRIRMTPAGALAVYGRTNASVETLDATTAPLALNTIVKIDLILEYFVLSNPSPNTYEGYQLFINGVKAIGGSPLVRTGNNTLFIRQCALGDTEGSTSLEVDFDDYIGAVTPKRFRYGVDVWSSATNYPVDTFVVRVVSGKTKFYRATAASGPANGGAVQPPNASKWVQSVGPADFYSGSHVVAVWPYAFTGNHNAGAWPGDVRLLQRHPQDASLTPVLTSTTSGALIECSTNFVKYGQGVGAITFAAFLDENGSPVPVGQVGGVIDGTTFMADANTGGAGGFRWVYAINQPGGGQTPRSISSLALRFTKALTTGSDVVAAMAAAVEFIGIWDTCDITPDPVDPVTPPVFSRYPGVHNGPYPDSPWAARSGVPPFGGVFARLGTYTGNGTAQDLSFGVPPHLIWIRPLTSPNGGSKWWSTMLGSGHKNLESGPLIGSGTMVVVQNDPTYVSTGFDDVSEEKYIARIVGTDGQTNNTGIVYQYLMLSDPASRYLLNGALDHGTDTLDDGAVDNLADSNFAALFGLFWLETVQNPPASTARFYGKGPGHAANEGSILNAAATASLVNIATTGQVKSFSAIHASTASQLAYALFRTVEPLAEVPSTVFQIGSYVGNGVSPRNIALTPVSSRRPAFAIVIPDNAASWFRDPSHSGGLSSDITSMATAANGITGGDLDVMIVGSALNANGVDYSFIVIPGSTVAGNDGWSINGDFILADPANPHGSQFEAVPPLTEADIDAIENQEEEGIVEETPDDFPAYEDESGVLQYFDPQTLFNIATLARSNICARVLHRLGDADQRLWTLAEVDTYIQRGASEMASNTRILWDQLYLENQNTGFSYTSSFEAPYVTFDYGIHNYTQDWEADYIDEDDRSTDPAAHTSPVDLPFLADQPSSISGVYELPRNFTEIERATWDGATIDALSPTQLSQQDSRYEVTRGEVYGYTLRHDGPRSLRLIRVPAAAGGTYTVDTSFGIPRKLTDVNTDTPTGSWGVSRQVPGEHPVGVTSSGIPWGLPRRFIREDRNVRIDYWRIPQVSCTESELPRRYMGYLANYAQMRCLRKNGPGQNFKLAQLYADRWARDLTRIIDRVSRMNKAKVSRMGGSDPSPRGGPPRPRLPWQYGQKLR